MNSSEEGPNAKKVLSIYNPSNHLINAQIIHQIFSNAGIEYQPHDVALFQKSLTHKSYIVITNPEIEYEKIPDCVELQPDCNERLENLGDAIIGSIVTAYLYYRYRRQNEGFLTKIKTKLVRTNMLAKFSLCLHLEQHMLISKHVEDMCEGRTNERILEDTFEAFVGALFEDCCREDFTRYGIAMQVCSDFIIKLIEDNTDFRQLIAINDNYKEQLLQYYHKHWIGLYPVYHELSVEGPTNRRVYTMGVKHPQKDIVIGTGIARKKTVAEQSASKEALDYFVAHPEPFLNAGSDSESS
jgi:ribonuclease III